MITYLMAYLSAYKVTTVVYGCFVLPVLLISALAFGGIH